MVAASKSAIPPPPQKNSCGRVCSSEEPGARATTDDEDLNKQTNIYKMQLKLICVLFEYLNNSSGCEKVSLDTIKIVNCEGYPVLIKR